MAKPHGATGRVDDSTFLAAALFGAALALGAVVMAAGMLAGLLSGRGIARPTDGLPQTVLRALTGDPQKLLSFRT